jgi:hypothetical protein
LVSINPKCGFFDWFRSATFDLKENIWTLVSLLVVLVKGNVMVNHLSIAFLKLKSIKLVCSLWVQREYIGILVRLLAVLASGWNEMMRRMPMPWYMALLRLKSITSQQKCPHLACGSAWFRPYLLDFKVHILNPL